jgi:4-diphosphocytidyl-2-C-methyl-D-erythritol kinase
MTRTARLRALAKINLDLRILERRADGFHELRTVFQTVSLADRIGVAFTPARRTQVIVEGAEIPDNLIARAAHAVLEETGATGEVRLHLNKVIPMGAGLGGGSSDAAAVLLALPALAGKRVDTSRLHELAAELGSDVPFFLHGGAVAGIGRGTELFPLPDVPPCYGVIVAPPIHVSTAGAYRALSPGLTSNCKQNKIVSFQSVVWGEVCPTAGYDVGRGRVPSAGGSAAPHRLPLAGSNDFEEVIFREHPRLAALKGRLKELGAAQALMSGSGSSIFGLFRTRAEASRAIRSLGEERVFSISLVSRARYRRLWWRQLEPHIDTRIWPPLSRYAQLTRRKP